MTGISVEPSLELINTRTNRVHTQDRSTTLNPVPFLLHRWLRNKSACFRLWPTAVVKDTPTSGVVEPLLRTGDGEPVRACWRRLF